MTWFEILRACRKLGEFTSRRLAQETGLTDHVATGWISKFRGWGYVRPTPEKAGRFVVYQITSWGRKKYAPKGKQAKRKA